MVSCVHVVVVTLDVVVDVTVLVVVDVTVLVVVVVTDDVVVLVTVLVVVLVTVLVVVDVIVLVVVDVVGMCVQAVQSGLQASMFDLSTVGVPNPLEPYASHLSLSANVSSTATPAGANTIPDNDSQ